MTNKIRVHFDGKVLVPDEPVDLPVGQPLEIAVRDASEDTPSPAPDCRTITELADWAKSLEPLPPGSLPSDLAAQHDHYLYGTPKRP